MYLTKHFSSSYTLLADVGVLWFLVGTVMSFSHAYKPDYTSSLKLKSFIFIWWSSWIWNLVFFNAEKQFCKKSLFKCNQLTQIRLLQVQGIFSSHKFSGFRLFDCLSICRIQLLKFVSYVSDYAIETDNVFQNGIDVNPSNEEKTNYNWMNLSIPFWQ